jgi:hypothetical protein
MYLLGENDNDPNSSSLDTSCQAKQEGAHRLQRGTIFFNYLSYYYGGATSCSHTLDTIPGVGHSNNDMYTSDCGVFSLFDFGSCKQTPINCTWVDFDYVGTESGTFEEPYNTLVEGIDSSPSGGTVKVKTGTSSETPTISKRVIVRAFGRGSAVVGN